MKMSYQNAVDQDVRLIILRALAGEQDYSINSSILTKALEEFGHKKSRSYVHNQLRWLQSEVSAVTLREVGSVLVATITRAGLDHVQMRTTLEGVDRPGPGN